MGVYLYSSGTENELQNAYIGEVVTQTYTDSINSNDANHFTNIAKSWFKVKSIHLIGNSRYESSYWSQLTSAYYKFVNMNTLTWTSSNPSIAYCSNSNEWIWQPSNVPSISKRHNTGSSTWTVYRDFSNSSWFNQYGSWVLEWDFNEDWWTITINWHTTTYIATADEKSLIQTLFEWSPFYFDLWTNRESVSTTLVVTYEPV